MIDREIMDRWSARLLPASTLLLCIFLAATLEHSLGVPVKPNTSKYSNATSSTEKPITRATTLVRPSIEAQLRDARRDDKQIQSVQPARRQPTTPRANERRRTGQDELSQLFREESNSYPEAEIQSVLRKTPNELKELYNVLNTPLEPNLNLTERTALEYSDEHGIREESVCRITMRSIYPREARRGNTLVYIPNNQDFMQVIQAEMCQNPEEDCNYLQDSLPYGMVSFCRQKYAFKKLLFLDSLEKRVASDLFRYPSCCSCQVRYSPIDLRSSSENKQTGSENSNKTVSLHSGSSPEILQGGGSGGGGRSNQTDSSLLIEDATDRRAKSASTTVTRPERNETPTVVLPENKVYKPAT